MDSMQFTALLQVLGRIADAMESQASYLKQIDMTLTVFSEDMHDLNTHPGFEAIQNIASSLDSIRRVGLPVEQG